MPNIKSSKKSVKTSGLQAISNTSYISRVKNGMKKIEKAIKDKNKDKANEELQKTISNIDKCAIKGLIKRNTADRQKSRLNKKVKEIN